MTFRKPPNLIKQRRSQSKSWWQTAATEHHNTHIRGNTKTCVICLSKKTKKEPTQIMVASSTTTHTYMEIKQNVSVVSSKTTKEPTQIMVAHNSHRAQQHTYMEIETLGDL